METNLIPAEIQKLVETQVDELIRTGTIEKIDTPEQYQNAGELVKKIYGIRKDFENRRKNLATPHRLKFEGVNEYFSGPKERIEEIEKSIDNAMIEFDNKKERERIGSQRDRDERIDRKRNKLESNGKEAEAATVVAPIVDSAAHKIKGISKKKTYFGKVIDKKAFIDHCISQNLLQFLDINIKGINKVLQATKGEMTFPGIKNDFEMIQIKRR